MIQILNIFESSLPGVTTDIEVFLYNLQSVCLPVTSFSFRGVLRCLVVKCIVIFLINFLSGTLLSCSVYFVKII